MIISPNYEPLPDFCGKRFLTTYLTITGFGAHGDSGDESFKEQLSRNKRCQKGAENVRKKFPEFFGIKTPGVRISPLGPKVQNPLMRNLDFSVCVSETRTMRCNADERCRYQLSGSEPLSPPQAQIQTSLATQTAIELQYWHNRK